MATTSSSNCKSPRQNVSMERTIDDISDTELFEAKIRTENTTKSYEGVIKKLKQFLKVPEDREIPIELLNDRNYALFSHEFGKETGYHKSQYKQMSAAILYYNSKYSLSNFQNIPHEWPLLSRTKTVSNKFYLNSTVQKNLTNKSITGMASRLERKSKRS